MALPAAPRHLSPAGQKLWESVVDEFELGEHHLQVLQLALEAADQAERARLEVESAGEYFTNPKTGMVRAHPAVAVHRDASVRCARMWRELRLDDTADDPRLPRSPGY